MASKNSAALRLTSLLLVLAIAQVYVLANPGMSLFGRLATSGDSNIIVNNSEARSGATILSGAQLQTPEYIGASVQLGKLGNLDLAPGTNLTLSFDQGKVDVNVIEGQAVLTAKKGVNGSVTFNGKVERTDPTLDSSTASAGAPAPAPALSKKAKAFWWIAGVGGIILLIWIIHEVHNNNSSPSRP